MSDTKIRCENTIFITGDTLVLKWNSQEEILYISLVKERGNIGTVKNIDKLKELYSSLGILLGLIKDENA